MQGETIHTARILIVGEGLGELEERLGAPFAGPSGYLLSSMLKAIGIEGGNTRRHEEKYWTDWSRNREVALTNVFNFRVTEIKNVLVGKKESLPGMPRIGQKYYPAALKHELDRLEAEIAAVDPNLIIALGGTALSVLTRQSVSIGGHRGGILQTPDGRKVLGTYHPAAILREYKLRPIVHMDLLKAKRHAEAKEFIRPSREIWIAPTPNDMERFRLKYMLDVNHPCGVDIETAHGSITEIGFAPRAKAAIVIPFYSRENQSGNYWETTERELWAWQWVADRLAELRKPVFQNGLYDLDYLWRTMGITVPFAGEDTMLLHHSLQPEMRKSLGFIGSLYTDEPPWKMMRKDKEKLKRGDTDE